MTIVVSHQQRIYYRLEGERGAFVILHHGLFGALGDWEEAGYLDALARDFRVILIDARGHGRSERPTEAEAYALPLMADDVVAVLNELEIRNAHFAGYSLGALVGFELVRRHPERMRLMMLCGEAPMVTAESQAAWRELSASARAHSLPQAIAAEREAERLVGSAPLPEAEQIEAGMAMLEAMAGWPVPEEESVPVQSPITVYCGGDDPALARAHEGARIVQRARFIPFGGYTHRRLFHGREALLEALLRFLRISRKPGEGGPERQRSAAPRRSAEPPRREQQPSAAEGVTADEAGAAGADPQMEPGSGTAPDDCPATDPPPAMQTPAVEPAEEPATEPAAEPATEAAVAAEATQATTTGEAAETTQATATGEAAGGEATPAATSPESQESASRKGRGRRRGSGRRGRRGGRRRAEGRNPQTQAGEGQEPTPPAGSPPAEGASPPPPATRSDDGGDSGPDPSAA